MDTERAALAALVTPQHTAVLIIDVQPLFTMLPLSPPLAEVLPRLRAFLDATRAAGVRRVFIRHVIPDERWTAVWQQQHGDRPRPGGATLRAALAPGSPLNEFAPGFEPEPDDLIVVKQRYSGFVGTELAQLLREQGIRTVVLVGLTTDICVSSTVRDAFHNEFHTVTLADCSGYAIFAALASAGLARLAADRADYPVACELVSENLRLAFQVGEKRAIALALEHAALLAAAADQTETLRLLAAAARMRELAGVSMRP